MTSGDEVDLTVRLYCTIDARNPSRVRLRGVFLLVVVSLRPVKKGFGVSPRLWHEPAGDVLQPGDRPSQYTALHSGLQVKTLELMQLPDNPPPPQDDFVCVCVFVVGYICGVLVRQR